MADCEAPSLSHIDLDGQKETALIVESKSVDVSVFKKELYTTFGISLSLRESSHSEGSSNFDEASILRTRMPITIGKPAGMPRNVPSH